MKNGYRSLKYSNRSMNNENNSRNVSVFPYRFPENSQAFCTEVSMTELHGISSQRVLENWRKDVIVCNRWFKFIDENDIEMA